MSLDQTKERSGTHSKQPLSTHFPCELIYIPEVVLVIWPIDVPVFLFFLLTGAGVGNAGPEGRKPSPDTKTYNMINHKTMTTLVWETVFPSFNEMKFYIYIYILYI